MLRITIPCVEQWDEAKQEFIYTKEQTLSLEHSLVSVSKWEAKWHKPFLSKSDKTIEETIDYVRCMTLTQNVDSQIYNYLTNDNISQVNQYIAEPMTATWIQEEKGKPTPMRKQITSELIYYWMITLNIPMECQKWHLNRLLMLIRVCNAENKPRKKRSNREILRDNARINAERRKRWNSKG